MPKAIKSLGVLAH